MNFDVNCRQRGFTLTEMAVVMVIVALLSGGLMVTLSTSKDIADINETRRQLSAVTDALLGFAASQGRLPCPASSTSGGAESPLDSGLCTDPRNGYLPASTLGISPVDAQGLAIDQWGNPIRYAVFPNTIDSVANPFTTPGAMKSIGLEKLAVSGSNTRKLLNVCGLYGTVSAANCGSATKLTESAVAVVFSQGKNGSNSMSSHESENTDNDIILISGTPTATFDDIVVWISPNVLYHRMITAGRLP